MNQEDLEFDPQLATDASGMTVNAFDRHTKTDPTSLILRPAFQRNLVWNDTQKSFLIDSILRGLPVPELYIQTTTDADGNERLVVVDGQQRISTCMQFLHDEIRLDDADDLDQRWRGKSFSQLSTDLKARFRGFKFVVRNLPATADDGVLREIFRRLNRTVEALEAQELRHAAYTGPFIQLVERAGAAEALQELGVFSPKDYLRRRNDEFVAEVLLAINAEAFPNKKEGLDQLFLTYERQGLPPSQEAELSGKFGRAVALIGSIAGELRRTRFRNKSDCYSLLVFLARHAERVTAEPEQADAILNRLKEFSAEVNALKRAEAQEQTSDESPAESADKWVLTYLRSVERAASDRLNRVRRHEALSAKLEPLLSDGAERVLSREDAEWPRADEDSPTDEDLTDRGLAREALLVEPR